MIYVGDHRLESNDPEHCQIAQLEAHLEKQQRIKGKKNEQGGKQTMEHIHISS